MKLYVKQKVFSWASKFRVLDEYGHERYSAQGEIFSWGHKLHVYDQGGVEVAFIKQQLWRFLPRYSVFSGDRELFQIVKQFTFFRPQYAIEGYEWEVEGDFWSHNYSITSGGRTVAAIRKEWFTWGDSYELDVADGEDEVAALCVLLTIDCVMASQAAAASSST